MKAYRYQEDRLISYDLLADALDIAWGSHQVISLVGAGGKTNIMYRLAEEAAAMGRRVVVTTSTHIYCPQDQPVVLSGRSEDIISRIRPGGIVVAGLPADGGKLRGLLAGELEKLAEMTDVLLVEADGAKHLPLKIPGEHEPVILPQTDLVIGSCGLDSIGRSMEDCCFRSGLAQEKAGIRTDHLITPGDIAQILTSAWGTRKGVGSCDYRIVLNKADTEREEGLALETAGRIDKLCQGLCAVTCFM